MDTVKQITEELRKSLAQHVGRRKFFNKLEMEQKLLQTRCQEEKRELQAKALRNKKFDSSKLSNSKTDTIQCLIKPESSSSASLSHQEVVRRLRFLKHPVTLFGEDEEARLDRLNVVLKAGLFQVDDSDMTEGQTNDFLRDILELKKSPMLKRKATDQDKDRDDEDLKRMKKNLEDLCDEDKILVFYKKLLNEWNQELAEMSPGAKNRKTDQGESISMVATLMQCARDLNPLFELCRKRLLSHDIRQALVVIVECCMNREYSAAMDQYVNKIAIGNAPWPIGVTMVGIHERTAREKIHTNSVAHIMNDETTRKLLHSVKRLVTFCQQRYPTMPSKCVEFNSQQMAVT